jgi:hypothetical protein
MDWNNVNMIFSFKKKLIKLTIWGKNIFFMGYIRHYKIIKEKMVQRFFCYTIMTIFSLKAKKKKNPRGSFILFKKWTGKLQSCHWKIKKYTCIEGFLCLLKKNSKITELTFHFEKKQRLFTRVFCFFFYWFYCYF